MRLIARFAKEKKGYFEIVDVFDSKTIKHKIDKSNPSLKTISDIYPTAIWFERKIKDEFGINFDGLFDKRELFKLEKFPKDIYPLRKDFNKKSLKEVEFSEYNYEVVNGDGVFQVGVGPIHAGIIEPGHFHFTQAGEKILHLEVRHFYKHRGIEKMCEGKTLFEAKPIIERISGNESIAYQIALRDIILSASNQNLPEILQKYHALLLEIERIFHHLTDLGFIANDTGFAPALAFCSRLSENARRILKDISNHRFGFEAVEFKKPKTNTTLLKKWLDNLEKEISFFEDWIIDIPSLWDRFDTTGILPKKKAIKYNCIGVVARACGIKIDVRDNDFYKNYGYKMVLENSGDVGARFKVRLNEVKNSIVLIKNLIEEKGCEIDIKDLQDGEYFSFVESSLGELFMAIDIKDGLIDRFYVRDPSFINWQALHIMMDNNIIADFPLINKSCDLSYAGNDL